MKRHLLWIAGFMAFNLTACSTFHTEKGPRGPSAAQPDTEWVAYGSEGGRKFSHAQQITPENAKDLTLAWKLTIKPAAPPPAPPVEGQPAPLPPTTANIQGTPLVIRDRMFLCSARGQIMAVNARTGEPIWTYSPDPAMTRQDAPFNMCRGVSYWKRPTPSEDTTGRTHVCAERIFAALFDGRLIALDAFSEKASLCSDFGQGGVVHLKEGMGETLPGELYYTSPPLVYSDGIKELVVVGGSILDDAREVSTPPSGVIRAFSAESGNLIWAFETVLPGFRKPIVEDTAKNGNYIRGTPNMWAFMTADPSRHTIFAPLGNPSPDHFKGARQKSGQSALASSLVAIDAYTGKYKKHFKTVKNDVWDYDIPAQPVLAQVIVNGKPRDVVITFTKAGMIFVLDRDTLQPVYGARQKPAPQTGVVAGEILSKTQTYPDFPPALDISRLVKLDPEHMKLVNELLGPEAVAFCESLMGDGKVIAGDRFMPPSLLGTLTVPGNGGGYHWGGGSYDIANSRLITNVQHVPLIFKLYPENSTECINRRGPNPASAPTIIPMFGAKYCLETKEILIPKGRGLLCTPPPYGELLAYDLNNQKSLWRTPLGFTGPEGKIAGSPNFGGTVQTAGGVTFVSGTTDRKIRAIDSKTGAELWSYTMEAPGPATPMTYQIEGEQYVAIDSGRHFRLARSLPDDKPSSYEEQLFVFKLK